jgi:DNA (cytosine-5)-methyltransferase 1
VVSASDYGFPQRRIRVFIVAVRTELNPGDPKNFVLERGILARAFPVSESVLQEGVVDLSSPADQISKEFNQGSRKSPFLNAGIYFQGKARTFKVVAHHLGPKKTLGDVLLPADDVPEAYFVEENRISEWEYLKGAKSIERRHKESGAIYKYAEGKMAFPDLLTNPSRTILTGEGGTTPSRFKHIISSGTGYRRLTPVELERLNGFPDNWTEFGKNGLPITDARRAFFMGNALVVGLIERVGKVIAEDLKASKN